MKKRHWINVYVAGLYHAAIHPRSHYVATVPIEFDDVADNQ